jgi:hypothetical protein
VDVTNFKCDVCDTNNIKKNIGVASYANEDGKCVPICKTGYVMNTNDPTKNNCGMCAVGYSFNSKGFCVPSSCPAGYVVNSTTNACTDCADGYTKNHMGLCAPTCTTGYALNTVTNKCDICATGYSLDNHGNCVPNACPTGYVFNADTNACTDCAPSYNKGADGKCSPVCTDPAYTVNPKTNDCTACSTGYSLYTDGVHCVPDCPAGYIVNTRDKYQCTACDTAAGYISDGSKNCIKPNIDGVHISVEIATEDLPNYNPNKPYIPLEPTLSDLVTNGFSVNIAVDVSAGGYNTGVVTCNGTKHNLPPNSSRSGNPVMFTNITLTTGSKIAVNVTLYDANQKVLSSVDKKMKLTSHVYTNDVAGQALPEGAFYAIGVAIGAGGGGAGAGSLNS